MILRRSILVLFLVVTCTLSATADDITPKKVLQQAYSAYDKSAKAGVPGMQKWCEENLASDFAMVFQDGNTLSRQQYLDMLQRLVTNPAPAWKDVKSQKTRVKKVEMQGTDAVAEVEIETTYDTKNPKRRTITLERLYKETWTKVGEAWKLKRTEEQEPRPTIKPNEKPKQPEAPSPRGIQPPRTYRGSGMPGG